MNPLKPVAALRRRRRADRAHSLRSRLVLLAVAIALPLVLFAAFMVVRSYQTERARLEEHSRGLARAFTLAVERDLRSKVMAVETLATAIPLQTGGLAGFRLQAELFLARQPEGTAIVLFDRDGHRLLDTRLPPSVPLPDARDRTAVRQVFETGRPTVSDLFPSALDGQPRVSVDVPVTVAGRVDYALSMQVPLNSLDDLFDSQTLPEGWIAAIVDRNGMILARNLSSERYVGLEATPALRAAIRSASEGSVLVDSREGESVVAIFSSLPATGWTAVIGIPQDDLEAPLQRGLWITAGGGALLAGVAALLAAVIADRIAKPILSLRHAAFALARGKMPDRPPAGLREVDAVGRALGRAGTLLRAAAAARDRTERALRRSEALLHRAQTLARLGHWVWTPDPEMDPRGGRSEYSPAGAALFGLRSQDLVVSNKEYVDRFVHPEDREVVLRSMQAFLESDRRERVQTYRVLRADGAVRTISEVAEKVLRPDGTLDHVLGIVQDITERKHGEERLRESERRERARAGELAALLDAVPAIVFVAEDPECRVISGSRATYELLRLPPGSNLSKTAATDATAHFKVFANGAEILGPALPLQRAARGETVRGHEEEIRFADGDSRYLYGDAIPLRDETGAVTGAIGAFLDITERKRGEAQQRLLTAELSHRVKNTLAVVQAIAAQTLRHAPSPEAFGKAFMGRLRALAAAHGLLTQTQWQSAGLADVVWKALRPHAGVGGAVLAEGPEVELSPKQTLGLSMVLHELATNAAKYGALSVPTGRVEVRWRRDGPEGRLSLQWRETGGPTVQPPAAEGFGVQLIRRTVAYDLDGEVMIGYEPAGLVGELVFPLSHEAHLGRTAS